MALKDTRSEFDARLYRPKESGDDGWAFVVLPRDVSAKLPRRGRTSVAGSLNGCEFKARLEPDGQKSHWLQIDRTLLEASGARIGDVAHFAIMAAEETEPDVPDDFAQVLKQAPEARAIWENITTIARVDWIHWIESAKQSKTRSKRVYDACEMLASGKKRVCCFDPSGFYSKALSAPEAADKRLQE